MFDEIGGFIIYTDLYKGGFSCTYSFAKDPSSPSVKVAKCHFKQDGILTNLVIYDVGEKYIKKFINLYVLANNLNYLFHSK